MNKLHRVSFSCTHHIVSDSLVSITPCKFPLYLSHLVNFPCTYHTLSDSHISLNPSLLVSCPCTYHTLSVSHVSITPCQFPMYLSHFVSFPCIYHTSSVSLVSITPRQFLMYSSQITIILFRIQSWLININILHYTLPLNCVILYICDMCSCLG